MFKTLTMQPMRHGSDFQAWTLRSSSASIDPYLGVDHAWMGAPTFGAHPHAGMSAVSYVFPDSAGGVHNKDSIGTDNLIRPGGLHWTTAGRGIVHDEVPAETGKVVHSLQIFVDLPRERKTVAPFPLILEPEQVPVVRRPGATVRVLTGAFEGVSSPIQPPTEVAMFHVSLEQGAALAVPLPAGEVMFVMPIEGTVKVDGQNFDAQQPRVPVFPAQTAASTVQLQAPTGAVELMVFAGKPLFG
jgi:redox-sensitive bicupin YhaK (pirin superfamily)